MIIFSARDNNIFREEIWVKDILPKREGLLVVLCPV